MNDAHELGAALRAALILPEPVEDDREERARLAAARADYLADALAGLARDGSGADIAAIAVGRVHRLYPITYGVASVKLTNWVDRNGAVWDLTRSYRDAHGRTWRYTGAAHHRDGGPNVPVMQCGDPDEPGQPLDELMRLGLTHHDVGDGDVRRAKQVLCRHCGQPINWAYARWWHDHNDEQECHPDDWAGDVASPVDDPDVRAFASGLLNRRVRVTLRTGEIATGTLYDTADWVVTLLLPLGDPRKTRTIRVERIRHAEPIDERDGAAL